MNFPFILLPLIQYTSVTNTPLETQSNITITKRAGKPSYPISHPRLNFIFTKGFSNHSRSQFSQSITDPLYYNPSAEMKDDNRRRGDRRDTRISKKQKLILSADEKLESKFGFDVFTEGEKRLGWLLTFTSVSVYTSMALIH